MDKIKQVLKNLGLTDKESVVYSTLLSCGSASAYTIAEKSGLKPPTVYLTLQNLISKNIAYTSPRSKKKLFYAKDPRELLSSFEEKVAQTKKALPDMLSLMPSDIPKIKVQYYQGKKGIDEALRYGRKNGYPTKDVVGFYADAENISDNFMEVATQYLIDSSKQGIYIRGITPDHDSTADMRKKNIELGHKIRVIPYKDYSAKASIEAEENFVRIVMIHEEKAIIIDNKELAKMVRQIFEMVWRKN